MENDVFLSLQQLPPGELWRFFPIGYFLTISVETPILLLALSRHHTWKRKVLAGLWLTACTYPIVVLVLPLVMSNYSRGSYLLAAEVFAPVAECILFWLAFGSKDQVGKASMYRDFAAIVTANVASFAVGELLNARQWPGFY